MDQDAFHRLVALNAAEQLKQARGRAMSDHQIGGPHSLEHVANVSGVDYINDSRATFLDASLRSMADLGRKVVWIAGSLPSDIAQAHVRDFLKEHVVALVLFGKEKGLGITALEPFTEHVYFAEEVRTATFLARELAREGETVLFSPACPSGDGFANYEERGAEFKRAVRDL
ncbi:MAG: hypothetical protein QM724_05495 [Flavobacteriales bacterium]